MYCFLLQMYMFQLSSALIPRLHTIETRGAVGHLYPTLWKVGGGGGGGGHILLFMVNI